MFQNSLLKESVLRFLLGVFDVLDFLDLIIYKNSVESSFSKLTLPETFISSRAEAEFSFFPKNLKKCFYQLDEQLKH